MVKRQRRFRVSTWLAMAGMVLQTLWPVVSISNEIHDEFAHAGCAAHDPDAVVQAHAHGAPAHHGSHKSHCVFCSSAAVCAVLPPSAIAGTGQCFGVDAVALFLRVTLPWASRVHRPAYPRAPPPLS